MYSVRTYYWLSATEDYYWTIAGVLTDYFLRTIKQTTSREIITLAYADRNINQFTTGIIAVGVRICEPPLRRPVLPLNILATSNAWRLSAPLGNLGRFPWFATGRNTPGTRRIFHDRIWINNWQKMEKAACKHLSDSEIWYALSLSQQADCILYIYRSLVPWPPDELL